MGKTITVEKVCVDLLRKQRDFLLELIERKEGFSAEGKELADGLVNLLDEMLDIAEGYKIAEYNNADTTRSL